MLRYFVGVVSFFSIVIYATLAFADHSHEYGQASKAYAQGDYKTAFHIWGEEAERGDISAQESLATMYASGKGTQQDYQAAIKWYQMAAEQGSASAQYTVGNMFYEGIGVKKSLAKAYAYLLVSAASGNQTAKVKQNEVFKEMSPEQIESAQELVFELLIEIAE